MPHLCRRPLRPGACRTRDMQATRPRRGPTIYMPATMPAEVHRKTWIRDLRTPHWICLRLRISTETTTRHGMTRCETMRKKWWDLLMLIHQMVWTGLRRQSTGKIRLGCKRLRDCNEIFALNETWINA